MIKVTRTQVDLKEGHHNEVAEVMVVLEDTLVIHSIKIKNINGSLFVCMPINHNKHGKKSVNGKKVPWDVVHPTNKEFTEYLNGVIIKAYQEAINSN